MLHFSTRIARSYGALWSPLTFTGSWLAQTRRILVIPNTRGSCCAPEGLKLTGSWNDSAL